MRTRITNYHFDPTLIQSNHDDFSRKMWIVNTNRNRVVSLIPLVY